MKQLTATLRSWAGAFWALGLAAIALDFFSVPILEHRASLSYVFFGLASACVAWAEKREFSTRIFLYRLHDAVIFTPWKYLLLYFLWISVFSPFTPNPKASLLYATNGWLSLFAVGISAQFIFCERGSAGIQLLPDRLRWIFRVYGVTVTVLLGIYLVSIFWPRVSSLGIVNRPANLFLYFSLGLPFLLWDFVKAGRRFLPRALSATAICLGTVLLVLVGRRYFQASLLFSVAAVTGFFLFKSPWRAKVTLRASLLAAAAAAGGFLALAALKLEGARSSLEQYRALLENNLRERFEPTWSALRDSHFLGAGLGLTEIRGVWLRVLAEAGVVGFALYGLFFLSLIWDLYRVKQAPRVLVSHVALISVVVFLLFASHLIENPYGAYVWIWYSIWALVASSPRRKLASF